MYTLEQLEKIWLATKPLYYRLVEGEKSNGLHRNTDFFEFKKTDNISPEQRATESAALWDRFLQFLEMINDGTYTLILQSSKPATSAQAPYSFHKGDPNTFAETKAVGNTAQRGTGLESFGGSSPIFLMLQLMQQSNAAQLAMQQQANEAQMMYMTQLFQKENELTKATQKVALEDKILGVISNPAVLGFAEKILAPQAVGRATAPQPPPTPPPSERETPTTPQNEATERLKRLIIRVKEAYPEGDPIAVMEDGFEKIQAYLAFQNKSS